jgi:methyl-accepting chemotaxis protein
MLKFRDLTIKQKLMIINGIPSVTVMVLAIAVFTLWEQIDSRLYMIKDVRSHAEMLADNCKAALVFDYEKDAHQVLHTLRLQESVIFACVYDKDDQVFAQFQSESLTEKFEPPAPREDGYTFVDGNLVVFKQVVLDGEKIGTVYLRDDMRRTRAELTMDITVAIPILLVAIVVGYLFASKLQRLITRPVLDLTAVAKEVSEKQDYSVRAKEKGKDELGYLTQVFNTMLDQIQQRDSALIDARDKLESRVKERTAELSEAKDKVQIHASQLQRFNRLAVGRELRMSELKSEINGLLGELGREGKYRDKAEISGSPQQDPREE